MTAKFAITGLTSDGAAFGLPLGLPLWPFTNFAIVPDVYLFAGD